jgi:hypothetical protein
MRKASFPIKPDINPINLGKQSNIVENKNRSSNYVTSSSTPSFLENGFLEFFIKMRNSNS